MKKILFFALATIMLVRPVFAVPNSEPTPEVTKADTAEEIQKLREVIMKKAQEKINQIKTPVKNENQSLIGSVTQISDSQIVIEYQNDKKTLNISEETVFIDAKRNKTKADKIKVGQGCIAMGQTAENSTLNTKRFVFTDLKTIENHNQVVVGKIVDISKSSPIFVLIPIKNKNSQYQIKTDSKTEVVDIKNSKIDLNKLKSGQKIIVSIKPDEKMSKTFYASKIVTLDNPETGSSPTPTPKKK